MKMRDFKVKRSANYAFLAYRLDRSAFSNLTIEGGWDGSISVVVRMSE